VVWKTFAMSSMFYGVYQIGASKRRGILVLAAFHVLNSIYQIGWLIYTLFPAGKAAYMRTCLDAALPNNSTVPISNSTIPAGNNTIVPDASAYLHCEDLYSRQKIAFDSIELLIFIVAAIESIDFAMNFNPPVIGQYVNFEEHAMHEREVARPPHVPNTISLQINSEDSELTPTKGSGDRAGGSESRIVIVDVPAGRDICSRSISEYSGYQDSHESEALAYTTIMAHQVDNPDVSQTA
jgi:hypothetical protein